MSVSPAASIIVPTRGRTGYLDVSLASIMPQTAELGAEVLVVGDGPDPAIGEVAHRHGARWLALPERRGANASRNAGVAATSAPVVLFIDDDIEAPAGWLSAMLDGVQAHPEYGVFGGPIRARFEGGARACGRHPPITNLDLGTSEIDAELVWSANMAVRRTALDRVGPFDETIHGRGEEEDWERRYIAGGGRIRYLPAAGLDHRRSAVDSRLLRLAQAEYRLGRTARRWDTRKRTAPPASTDARWLVRWGLHTLRRRCAHGIVSAAHYVGRLREAVAEGRGAARVPTL